MSYKCQKHWKNLLLFAFKLTVSTALIWYVFNHIDFIALKDSLRGARISHLLIAFFVLACGAFAGSLSWYSVIRANGLDVRFMRVVAMHLCGMFFNSFLPSNIGGDLYKGWMLVKDQSSSVSTVASSIIVDRILNFALLIIIGLVSFSVAMGKTAVTAAIISLAIFAFIMLNFVANNWKIKEGDGKVLRFLQELMALFRSPQRCAIALCAATLSQGCKIGCNVFIISALGLSIDYSCVWYIIPVFGVVSALPISLGGLGVRESVAMLISGTMVNVINTDLVILSLMSHALFIAVNALGVIPLIFYRRNQ